RSPIKSRRHCRRLCFFHSSASSFRILDRTRPTRASTSPMKLFYAPGSSSLLPHIVLHEAGLPFTAIKVDEHTKVIEGGGDYEKVTPLVYVPALVLDDATLLTEGAAAKFLLE